MQPPCGAADVTGPKGVSARPSENLSALGDFSRPPSPKGGTMYIEKRWIVPATLSLLLCGTLFAVVVLALASHMSTASGVPSAVTTDAGPSAVAPGAAT